MIELPKEKIESLPTKAINYDQYNELIQELDYNPEVCYNLYVELHENEIGHDLNYRYILDPKKEKDC